MFGAIGGLFAKLTLGTNGAAADEARWPTMKVAFPTVTVFLVEPNQAAENGTRLPMERIPQRSWTVLRAIAHAQIQLQNPVIPLSRHGLAFIARVLVLHVIGTHVTRVYDARR
jgi:hypothetical protein